MGESLILKKSPLEIFANIYREYRKYPFVGIFRGTSPTVLICDPELIKDITVKSFQNFHDNDADVDKKRDPILGRNPFCLKGEEWKTTRSQLTSGFTSGKMKWIYPLLEDVGQKLVTFMKNQPNGKGYEVKDLCSKFTLDNVANCAFGMDAKAFTSEITEFQQVAKKFFETSTLSKLLQLKFVKQETESRLINIVTQTIKYREKNSVVRNDFLHLLIQLKKTCKDFTDVDVTAQAASFFLDGYETSATVMSFVLYELAANPQVQSRLREEVNKSFDGDKLSYDVLQESPCLDAVIKETLRIHPPLFSLGKICTKDYIYVPKEGDHFTKLVKIEKGTQVVIPILGLHKDPDYFEEPDNFNPDRFIGTNKEKIVKYTYMPFGEGPRACLGRRFGVLQIKVGIAYIIKNFKLTVNAKTKVPLQYDPMAFITAPIGGLWIDIEQIAKFSDID